MCSMFFVNYNKKSIHSSSKNVLCMYTTEANAVKLLWVG